MRSNTIMTPSDGLSARETVQRFYFMLPHELQHAGYSDAERALLADERLYYGRYLNPGRRNYFVETVIPQVAHAVSFLMAGARRPRILDLGCGLGMQSIIFASLGAKVVGIDVREEAIALCIKRKAYHERLLGRRLDVEFIQRDFLLTSPEDFRADFDAVFSMAAFSSIQPVEQTARLVSTMLRDDAKIFIYEKNSDHPLHQLRNSPEPGPTSIADVFAREGFDCCFLEGGCALPGPFWKFARLNETIVRPANDLLKKTLRLSFNYVLGFQRRSRATWAAQQHRVSVFVLCVYEYVEELCFVVG